MRSVYDFDNTILRGDSTARFAVYALTRRPGLLLKVPGVLFAYLGWALKINSKQQAKETLFRALCPSVSDAFIEAFWDRNIGRVKRFYRDRHREDDLVISASPEFLLEGAMRRLGIGHLIASPVDRASGRFLGRNCHGEEKTVRFREIWNGEPFCFYSDSLSDAPMARLAAKAYLVKGERIMPWPEEKAT